MKSLTTLTFFIITLFLHAKAAPVVEPEAGQAYLGIWLDTEAATTHATEITYGDNPRAFNERTGFLASSFQFAQNIPMEEYDWVTGAGGGMNQTMIEETASDASIFLTVYPYTGLNMVTDQDFEDLANQILNYQSAPYNRSVFLRYAPEMNGQWMSFGVQPTAFVQQWQNMATIVRRIAPETALVWAPNFGEGYPFSIVWETVSPADQALLDTDGDGVLSSNDDPYIPYYPGDEYVDWSGISLYWKGAVYPYLANEALPQNYVQNNLAWGPNFYETYCTRKPCCLAESGSAFHTNDGGLGQSAMQSDWHLQFLSNASFYAAYPQLKMIQLFEHAKVEDLEDMRDYRISFDADVRRDWLAAIEPLFASNTLLQASAQTAPDLTGNATDAAADAGVNASTKDSAASKGLVGLGVSLLSGFLLAAVLV